MTPECQSPNKEMTMSFHDDVTSCGITDSRTKDTPP